MSSQGEWLSRVRARHELRGHRKPEEVLRHTVACRHRFSASKGLRSGFPPHYASARLPFRSGSSLPIIEVTASDIGLLLPSNSSQRSRKLSHETARLALTTATHRLPTATDSMHMGPGYSARRSEPSKPICRRVERLVPHWCAAELRARLGVKRATGQPGSGVVVPSLVR
jgi:hypothetical protein